MKAKRTLFQSIKKDLKKGVRRFYWYTYTKIKYHYLSLAFRIKKKKITTHSIGLLCPTRERSKKFSRMLESLNNTCFDKKRIDLLILLDNDEPEKDSYHQIIRRNNFKDINIKIFTNKFKTNAERFNFLASNSTSNLFMPINDDITFVTKSWDKMIDLEFSKIGNDPYCLWINNNQKYKYLHCDFPIVNFNWYKRLGYIGSNIFNFWYLDTWICDLSFYSKKFLVSPKIEVYQHSANTFEKEVDNTYLKNIKDGIPEKDYQIWLDSVEKRKRDSKLLL